MSDRAQSPDPESLTRHGASVRALATAIIGDENAADDVVQEAYLAAIRSGSASIRNPGPWLRGVGRNLSRRWLRTESRRRRREEAQPVRSAPASPEETAQRLETEAQLTEAVRALAEPYRSVVVLRYFDGLSTAETADRTGVPEATVKTRLRRALAMLRAELDDRHGDRTAWLPLLVQIARPRAPIAGVAAAGTTALIAGGAIMAKKILIITAVAAVVAAVFLAPEIHDRFAPQPVPELTGDAPLAPAELPNTGVDSGAPVDGETGAATEDESMVESFRVVVYYPDGEPAEGAKVLIVDPKGEARGTAKTGSTGSARLPATGGRATLLVIPRAAGPEKREIEALVGGEVEVRLSTGSVISGTLFIDDRRAAGVEVRLHSHDRAAPVSMSFVTEADGRFLFSGLPAGSDFFLFAGWDVFFPDGEAGANVDLVAPATDLALRAKRYPTVRGVVVDAEGAPVAGAPVQVHYRTVNGGGSMAAQAGPDGRFDLSTSAREPIERLSLTVEEPEGAGREVIEIEPERIRGGSVDVGRIILRPTRTYRFLVRGPDGGPIAGAVVVPTDDRSAASVPTDESGQTGLEVAGGTTAVRVAAVGTGLAELVLPDQPDSLVTVDLPVGTLLTIRLGTKDGRVPDYLSVLTEADGWLFEGRRYDGERAYHAAGSASPYASHSSEERSALSFLVPEDGVLRMAGIRPGVGFRLVILDRVTGRRIQERKLTLGTGEHRELDWPIELEERELTVAVRDPEDRPVPGARVEIDAGGGLLGETTGSDGVARITGVRGEAFMVTVERHGSAPWVGAFTAEELPRKLEVVLRHGRDVRLTVTGPDGSPVACEWAEARAPGLDYEFQGEEVSDGVYEFRDLPPGPAKLIVIYAGARHEVAADAATEEARLEVPPTGSVLVRFVGRLDEPTNHRVRLVPTAEGDGTEIIGDVGYTPDRERWEISIPAVMPGRYEVILEHWVDGGEEGEDRYEPCRTGPAIEVSAGRETEGTLRR